MKQVWTPEELGETWTLTFDELNLLKSKPVAGWLGFCAQLKYYRLYACFPQDLRTLAFDVREYLAQQINVNPDTLKNYAWNNRTGRRHRQKILEYLNVESFDDLAKADFQKWLLEITLPQELEKSHLNELVVEWFINAKIDPPGRVLLERAIKSAQQEYERYVFSSINQQLNDNTHSRLDELLTKEDGLLAFTELKADSERAGLKSVLKQVGKLKRLRRLGLSKNLLAGFNPRTVDRFRQRAATESAWELRRHPEWIRYPLLIFYCIPREAGIIDSLIELLIQIKP